MEFYQKLSQYYDIIFPVNQQSITFLSNRIAQGKLLDLAAGTGNHAIALAKLGFPVTATDLDAHMIDKIKEKADNENVSVNAMQLAMEQLDTLNGRHYSTIICLGNSLVHLECFDDVKKAILNMYQLLQENGKLIIQVVNYDRILAEGITELPLINKEIEQVKFRRTYQYVNNYIVFQGELTIGEDTIVNKVKLLPITSLELKELLTESGFHSIKLYGSFKGEEFQQTSPALIIEAVK